MLRIDRIADLSTAKQVAQLLEQENARLHKTLVKLTAENAALRGEDGSRQLALHLMKLEEQMKLMQHRLYGASSEKRPPGDKGKADKDKKPRTGHGPRKQPDLPIIEVVHGFEPEDLDCNVCGGTATEWQGQFEESEEITVVERTFVIHKHMRKKARCACNAKVITAPGPLKLIAGGRYSIEFAIEVAVAKYLDHNPLQRQVRTMKREGLLIDGQTLWDQINALARYLEPTYDALLDYQLDQPYLHADETPWYLLTGKPAKKWYMWSVVSPYAAYYWIDPSRSTEAARHGLGDYDKILIVDGYAAYKSLARGSPTLELAFCWSHCRRKVIEAETFYPDECAPAVELFRQLYRVESEVPNPAYVDGEAKQDALALRNKLRNERSRPIVEQIRTWMMAQRVLPESTLGKAIGYINRLWNIGLLRFLDDPQIPIDNNPVERELRSPVIGRKNHYGSRSKRGTEVASLFYSLIETARLAGVEPKAYLAQAARAAIDTPGTVWLPPRLRS